MKKTSSIPVRVVRCLRVGLLILSGISTVAVIFPFIDEAQRLARKRHWSGRMLHALAIRVDGQVGDVSPGTLFVGNHISWLDIFALNAMRPVSFVTKSEVRSWPLFGWLVANSGNLFIRRGYRQDAIEACKVLSEHLKSGRDVAIFPEGTTSDGRQLLEFRGGLLQSAIDCNKPVQPLALAYYDNDGERTTIAAYAGKISMVESLMAVLSCTSLTISLTALPLVDTQGRERKELAVAIRQSIARQLGLSEDLPDEVGKRFLPECLQSKKQQ